VLLVVPDLAPNQVLVHAAPDSPRARVEPTPRLVLLERWALSFARTPGPPADVAPSTSYKLAIPLFRSLYALLRLLPAWALLRRLRRRTGRPNRSGLSIRLRPRAAAADEPELGFMDFGARHLVL
jgi:autophagy-related protein 13